MWIRQTTFHLHLANDHSEKAHITFVSSGSLACLGINQSGIFVLTEFFSQK